MSYHEYNEFYMEETLIKTTDDIRVRNNANKRQTFYIYVYDADDLLHDNGRLKITRTVDAGSVTTLPTIDLSGNRRAVLRVYGKMQLTITVASPLSTYSPK